MASLTEKNRKHLKHPKIVFQNETGFAVLDRIIFQLLT